MIYSFQTGIQFRETLNTISSNVSTRFSNAIRSFSDSLKALIAKINSFLPKANFGNPALRSNSEVVITPTATETSPRKEQPRYEMSAAAPGNDCATITPAEQTQAEAHQSTPAVPSTQDEPVIGVTAQSSTPTTRNQSTEPSRASPSYLLSLFLQYIHAM